MGQGGARREAADRVAVSAIPVRRRWFCNCVGVHERQANTILLDPGDPALVHDRGILCHHQAKALRDEGWIVDIDRRPLARDVPHHATHDGTARRNIGRLVDLRSRIFAFLFHPVRPVPDRCRPNRKLSQNLKQVGACAAASAGKRLQARACRFVRLCDCLQAPLCRAAGISTAPAQPRSASPWTCRLPRWHDSL
jgi:hypothetical protein